MDDGPVHVLDFSGLPRDVDTEWSTNVDGEHTVTLRPPDGRVIVAHAATAQEAIDQAAAGLASSEPTWRSS